MENRARLPVDEALPAIVDALRAAGAVVLEAPPGTGKTTRVPVALADAFEGQVWVLEPRRIAARAAAARVAREHGTPLGAHVGYAMRLDRRAGPATRVLYVTEALLTRRLVEDPSLAGIGVVVLDEFHERSIHADVALAWVRTLRGRRPDLRLVVMSATLDGQRIATALGCPRLRVEAPLFPVDVQHVARADDRPIEVRVTAAVRACADRGDILVFLPGAGEIQRCAEALAGAVPDRLVLPLHGELDANAQDRALRREPGTRRVVLATNVAETSVTVDGVDTVIDTGLARIAAWDPWSGLGTLELAPVARASATQRAGRAGRQGPGLCLRLYTSADFEARPADTLPELARADLAETVLGLAAAGAPDLAWLDPPPPAAWAAALALLRRLGALDAQDALTPLGRAMARVPAHPRAARVLVAAAEAGVAHEGAALVAAMGERTRTTGVVDRVQRACEGRPTPTAEREQLLAAVRGVRGRASPRDPSTVLTHALFAGYGDRVGQRRGGLVTFAEGGRAELDPATPGGDAWVVVPEVERIGGRVRVRAMTPIPEDLLLDGATLATNARWTGTRVEVREQLCFGALVLEESPGNGDPAVIEALLHTHAAPVAHRVFPDHDRAAALVARVDWLFRCGTPGCPEAPPLDAAVRQGCTGCRSLDDLGGVSLVGVVRAMLDAAAPGFGARVDALAPESIALPRRARVPVTYPPEGEPFVASRMQDFFGLREGPRAGNGRPFVLHLLAPNQRPVQVTSDLPGFWERHWPGIRKELMRRYPRHRWPEDPRAIPPEDRP